MPRWFDREGQQLEQELERGEITQAQFNAAIRELRAELREAADEAGQDARDDYLNG